MANGAVTNGLYPIVIPSTETIWVLGAYCNMEENDGGWQVGVVAFSQLQNALDSL